MLLLTMAEGNYNKILNTKEKNIKKSFLGHNVVSCIFTYFEISFRIVIAFLYIFSKHTFGQFIGNVTY